MYVRMYVCAYVLNCHGQYSIGVKYHITHTIGVHQKHELKTIKLCVSHALNSSRTQCIVINRVHVMLRGYI